MKFFFCYTNFGLELTLKTSVALTWNHYHVLRGGSPWRFSLLLVNSKPLFFTVANAADSPNVLLVHCIIPFFLTICSTGSL